MHPIIIIGSGLAGYTLAREFRKLDKNTSVTLITTDDGASYSKPMLSNALSKKKDASSLVIASAEKMAKDLNLSLLANTKVKKIDSGTNSLETDQDTHNYSKLVFAVGAKPIIVPTAGNASDDILSINNLADYDTFRKKLVNKKHIAILGPGLIGCEFANDLANSNYKVSVVGPDKLPLANILPERISHALKNALTDIGVNWHLETLAKEINRTDSGFDLIFDNGTTINADLVLSAVGLKPDTTLATAAGIAVNRGIVVNRELRTSEQNIFALGDCMEIDGLVLPFVMPIMHCARALASTLAGEQKSVTFPAMPIVVKTPAYNVVACPPHQKHNGQWELHLQTDNSGVKACYYDSRKSLLGFALSGWKTAEKELLAENLPGYLD